MSLPTHQAEDSSPFCLQSFDIAVPSSTRASAAAIMNDVGSDEHRLGHNGLQDAACCVYLSSTLSGTGLVATKIRASAA